MANIKSQIKRNRQNEKRRLRNKSVKSSLKTAVRKFNEAAEAGDVEKAKKIAAERKMEYTQQNLLRVSDVIGELQNTLASLKRQAQKAERYKKYRAEIRDLELWVASHRWLELTTTHRVASSRLQEVEARVEGARAALRVREAELEA